MTTPPSISSKQYEDVAVAANEKSGIACDRLRQELKRCIKESDCVQIDRRPAKECLDSQALPHRCYSLFTTFTDCKRSIIDARSRFRGRKGDL